VLAGTLRGWRHEPGLCCASSGPVLAVWALPPGVLRVPAGGGGMRRKRELVAAGVIRAGRRHDAIPAGARRPVQGVNLLDTPLGAAEGMSPAPLMAVGMPEPELSARYRVPSRPGEPVDQVRAGQALSAAVEGLALDHDTFRLLAWADSWSAVDRAALAALVEAARAGGGVR
jgi:hypothetical protein